VEEREAVEALDHVTDLRKNPLLTNTTNYFNNFFFYAVHLNTDFSENKRIADAFFGQSMNEYAYMYKRETSFGE
jgi:hypothetical protein